MRRKARTLTPEELAVSRPGRHPWAAVGWELSVGVGRLAGVCVCLFLVVLMLGGTFHLRERLAWLVPDWAAGLFTAPLPEEPKALEGARAKIKEGLLEAGKRGAVAGTRRERFGVGSTKEDVLAIQGIPSSATEEVWTYGGSRVYFSGGRVVSWSSAGANALKTR